MHSILSNHSCIIADERAGLNSSSLLGKFVPSLQKTFGVEDYQRATAASRIEKMVFVEWQLFLPEQGTR